MKHIKCSKCGTLTRPAKYIDHYRNCTPTEDEKATVIQDCEESESPQKRQRIDDHNIERKHTVDEECDSIKKACSKCGKLFSKKWNCLRHEKTCEGTKHLKTMKTACKKCSKQFSDYRGRLRHEKICGLNKTHTSASFSYASCDKTFSSVSDLTRHEQNSSHNRPGTSGATTSTDTISTNSRNNNSRHDMDDMDEKQPLCRLCNERFENFKILYAHRMMLHKQPNFNFPQDDPWGKNNEIPPWLNEDGSENESLRSVYEQHRHLILRERVSEGQVRNSYNFPVPNISNINQLMEQIEFIFQRNQNAFKINLSFGFILQHIETADYRYFVPHYTDGVFLFPQLINDRTDIERLRARLSQLDLSNYFHMQRPNTKWRSVFITNVMYTVFKTSFPLGLSQPLPSYIRKSKSILSFERNTCTGRLFDDKYCFFRCLAYHRKKNVRCEKLTLELLETWRSYCSEKQIKRTHVTLENMPYLENCFTTNINVFTLNEERIVTILYKSRCTFKNNEMMNLNLYEDHLSYISKFNSYASKFKCRLCSKLFDSRCHVLRHEKICANVTKLRFPGGYFSSPKTIFDKLEDLGINVDTSLRNYPWFITFDMEAILTPVETQNPQGLTKTQTHHPISASVSSNVDGFKEPEFIMNEDLDQLLTKMISHLNDISNKAYSFACNRWVDVFRQLDSLKNKWTENSSVGVENNASQNNSLDDDNDDINYDHDDSDHYDDDDDDQGDNAFGHRAMESNDCEPPSVEFLNAMSKENVYYSFLKSLEEKETFSVTYNDWDDNVDNSEFLSASRNRKRRDSSSSNSSSNSSIDIQPFSPLNHSSSQQHEMINRQNDDSNGKYPITSEYMLKLINRTREQFETYCHQVPVIGFNSAKYDINLLKSKLAKHLKLHVPKQQKFVVKRNNAYLCLSNAELRFLDMVNYLPPGTSYDQFLRTFGVSQRKSYFPYEYFTNMSVLENRSLPPKEAFYSSLKQCNVLEDHARVAFERLTTKENKTEYEALSILGLQVPPASTINKNYQMLQQVWQDNGMTTFRDFLEYYNSLDVLPMVEGVEKFKHYFVERGIDVFKDCISVPGAARKMLYQSGFESGASFTLIDKCDEDLYHTIKSNIVGGPSIIFTRYQEAGQTNIRENENRLCQSVLGYDANSLYVYALGKPMPVGNYIRRRVENKFKPEKGAHRYVMMYDWMEWLNYSQNLNIKHKQNHGNEKRVGPYLVDGFNNTNVIFEFYGCYFHGHSCITPKNEQQHNQRYTRTQERSTYLQSLGYEVVFIWECEFTKQVKQNETMRDFINQRYPTFYKTHTGRVTDSQILDSVVKDELFGFIEVDIRVPDSWDQVKFQPKTDLNPEQYFHEMCPLFCTTEVDFDCIGEHMQRHAEKYGLSTKPRTLLVGGTNAECLLLSSPLLKWYIEHGLLVTKIYQVVEFSKQSCFKTFVDKVTDDRRLGDKDKSQELKSSLSKLVGVSAFGGTIINQEKFQKTKYVEGFKNACFAVNNPRFRDLNELDDDMFETEFANTNISINSPVYLGYMILQYAKLHMLSFYYDFLLKFVGMENFEMAEMDTDSCYFGLASVTLRDAIKPKMQTIFDQTILGNCRDDFTGDDFNAVWFPRECCAKHNKYDLRTPGLMKLEFNGTQIIGLCSKSYIAVSTKDMHTTHLKYSLKGVNNQFIDPSNSFKEVLNTQEPITAVNRGIRSFNNTVYTYVQPKQAFNYFYCKRLVLPDGIHTKPLDIVLKPFNRYKQSLKEQDEELNIFLNSINP